MKVLLLGPNGQLGTDIRKAVETCGEEVTISSRPSDAIALAARTDCPVFASRAVLDEGGVEIRDEDQEEEIERFREFLDDVTPEDFGSGTTTS